MKLSTKARYGLRAMIELALHYNKGPMSVKTIAENQEISEAYLEQLMSFLTKRNLAKSIRGVQGGYFLAREPSKIKVGDVVRALEGPLVPVECVNREDPVECARYDKCVSRIVWERMRNVMEEVLDSLTLQNLKDELVNREQALIEDKS
ncbi:MAG: RrF2 family transcriptional regulator [Peptococcaceae bacterium]